MTKVRLPRTLIALGLICIALNPACPARADEWQDGPGYRTFVIGNELAPTPGPIVGGLLLNGGGGWPLEAFRWFTAHAGHGHLVVLRASGTTEIQDELYKVVGGVLSVRTFVFTDRTAASDARLLAAVKTADAVFIGGGDQSNYVRMWRGTPLNAALDAHLAAGKPMGGTSAGLAIQGAWLYGCMDSISVTSAEAMADPLGKSVTVEGDFLHDALLAHVLTDSHFDTRDRIGRLFAFLANAHALGAVGDLAGLGIDEGAALTVETDGTARLHALATGKHAWLVQPGHYGALQRGQPLNLPRVRVTAIGADSTFHFRTMTVDSPAFIRSYDISGGAIVGETRY